MRDSSTRHLLVLGGHELHAPEYLFEEIEAHFEELSARSGLPREAMREALRLLRSHVIEHAASDYEARLKRAERVLEGRDVKDAPYVALTLALAADGIWTEDRGLLSQESFHVYRTSGLLKLAH